MRNLHTAVKGILFMIASMAFFSAMNIGIRYSSFELHTTQIVLLRNLFSIALLAPWVLRHSSDILHTTRLKSHFWRGTIGTIGMQSWFFAVSIMPLNQSTALSFTAPIFTAIFAILFLKEKAGLHRWSAILMGFIGAMIIIQPGATTFDERSFVVLFATSMWAIAGLLVKSLTKTESSTVIIFYMALVMTLWSFPLAIPHWHIPSTELLLVCLFIALCSTGAHWCLVSAYRHAELVVLMPFDFSRLIFTAIFAYFAFGEVASSMTWVGAGIIVVSTMYIAHREALHHQRKKEIYHNADIS